MTRRLALFAWLAVSLSGALAQAPLTINGVTDKASYTDKVSFWVPSTAGYSQAVLLNGRLVPSDLTNVIATMDYYEVSVWRTNDITSDVTNRVIRFVVISSNRGGSDRPEFGLMEWTPYPTVPSAAPEVAGASLRLIVPAAYPQGLEIPVIAWLEDANGDAVRANGSIVAAGFESVPFKIRRGVGCGFIPPATAAGVLNYDAHLHSVTASKQVNIDASTTWTLVSGTLNGVVNWPANSRIRISSSILVNSGATLTVGAGTVVRLDALANITNWGRVVVNGTADQPVVFTSTNHIVPEDAGGAWGGFVMRTNSELVANYAILNGGGGANSWTFSPASSHKSQQPVLFLQFGAKAALTNSAVIHAHGQIGSGYQSSLTIDHTLFQRAITCGEWDTCTNIYNHSALIEFPEERGIVNSTIANADYDAIYLIKGTNLFTNTLVGFAQDDAIDSGSDGSGDSLGAVRVERCWIESALHESLAWSGHNRLTLTFDTVSMNSGQGIENGWTDGSATYANNRVSPDCYANHLLTMANSVGARVGDNYNWGYRGFLHLSNSIVLNNYRDVFLKTWNNAGTSWDTNSWVDRLGQIDLENCILTTADPRFPGTPAWNPAADGPKLAYWMTTPPNAPVGIGVAIWTNQYDTLNLSNGVPVRLSSFTTNPVSVSYTFNTVAGVENGTLTFVPGETLKRAIPATFSPAAQDLVRFSLGSPVNGEITGRTNAYYVRTELAGSSGTTTLIASNSAWRYLDDGSNAGTAWRDLAFNDTTWSNNLAQLGFGDNDERTVIRSNNAGGTRITTTYFRRTFTINKASDFDDLSMTMIRDDGGVVYLNGKEVFRSSSMPAAPATITYQTFADAEGAAPSDNTPDRATLSATNLVDGTNIVAVEIHQFNSSSSDLSFEFQLIGNPASPQHIRLGLWDGQMAIVWSDPRYVLEQAGSVTGPWTVVSTPSPLAIAPGSGQKFYRLRK